MNTLKVIIIFLLLVALKIEWMGSAYAQDTTEKVVKIAAIDWCPQICPQDPSQNGYVLDIVKRVFEGSAYTLQIDYFPWSRAIQYVRQGKYQVLLSPAKKEAPDLTYPQFPIGTQQMCFISLKDFDWYYQGLESLAGVRVLIATDTSVEELNSFVLSHPSQVAFIPYSDTFITRAIEMLEKDRVETFMFTLHSSQYVAKQDGKYAKLKVVGCVSEAPIYFALSSSDEVIEEALELQTFFDSRIKQLILEGDVDDIMQAYELRITSNNLLKFVDPIPTQ
ncbi:substrate-binding periplasmic protein [Alteromonas facilis]|uniref:substrate-binding periplasmic protein n=1 Tax=Alteromonas facilis TaxID=2048004 RepID=UPI000C284C54|nr:transporter substrate-binding domain-containing protein [Alteromonas facilis]